MGKVRRFIGARRMVTDWFIVGRGWYSRMIGNPGGGRACTGGWCGGVALGNGIAATALVRMLESWSSSARGLADMGAILGWAQWGLLGMGCAEICKIRCCCNGTLGGGRDRH